MGFAATQALHAPASSTIPQAHRQAWLYGPLSGLDPEAVDKEVAVANKALVKLGKVIWGSVQVNTCVPVLFNTLSLRHRGLGWRVPGLCALAAGHPC